MGETAGRALPNPIVKLWDLLVSPSAFVVASCLWCLDLAIGSIVAHQKDPDFWKKMDSVPFNLWFERFAPRELPYSLWVYILVALTWVMMVSLLFCTVQWFFRRRAKKRGLAEVLVHLGFLLVFIGFVVGSGWGERAQNIAVTGGQTVDVKSMGVKLRLEGVDTVRDERGETLDTVSRVALLDDGGGVLAQGTARLNHPLIHGQTVVYPMGGGERLAGARVVAGRLGVVEVLDGTPAPLPDGRLLLFRGGLAEGERADAFVGPGAYLVTIDSLGRETAGAYVGAAEPFQTARLGNLDLAWGEGVMRAEAVFNVHRDPGVQFVLAGAFILTLGTLWALAGYLRRTA